MTLGKRARYGIGSCSRRAGRRQPQPYTDPQYQGTGGTAAPYQPGTGQRARITRTLSGEKNIRVSAERNAVLDISREMRTMRGPAFLIRRYPVSTGEQLTAQTVVMVSAYRRSPMKKYDETSRSGKRRIRSRTAGR